MSSFYTRPDRRFDRPENNWFGALLRRLRPSELLSLLTMIGLAALALGWRPLHPEQLIKQLDQRVTQLEQQTATFTARQDFEMYLTCISLRKTVPDAVPPDCERIIMNGPPSIHPPLSP